MRWNDAIRAEIYDWRNGVQQSFCVATILAGWACEGVYREAHVKAKTCPDCNGDGVIEKGTSDEQQCPTCGGSGFVPDDDDDEEVTRTGRLVTNPGKRR